MCFTNVVKNSLKMCYWNVGSIVYTHNRNKLDDELFVQEIKHYDLIIFQTTRYEKRNSNYDFKSTTVIDEMSQ